MRYIGETITMIVLVGVFGTDIDRHPQVSPADACLAHRCQRLGEALGLRDVAVFRWDHPFPNAIPIGGPTDGVLLVSTPLIELLSDAQLEAALAHELAHLRHGDSRRLLWIGGACLSLAVGLIHRIGGRSRRRRLLVSMVVLLPTILGLLGVLRVFERQADRSAVAVTGDERALAGAIIAVRTGRDDVDVRNYDPPRERSVGRLLSMYPRLEDRFPSIFDEQPADGP